jgi:acetolactate synthase-1/2/3 large subunit
LVHVDASPGVLGANYPASLAVLGDVAAFLQAALVRLGDEGMGDEGWPEGELAGWRARFRAAKEEVSRDLPRWAGNAGQGLGPFFRELRRLLPRDSIVVTDTGLHQVATRRFLEVLAPRGLILPSDFQSMGFGLPAAIGAALGNPRRRVVAVLGDGGMAMVGLELATAVREGLSLTVIVFNDGHLGQIRLKQIADFGRIHGTRLAGLDLRSLAAATGASYAVMGAGDPALLAEVMGNPGVTLVDVLLTDAPGVAALQRRALLRTAAGGLLGRSQVAFLKKLVRRFAGPLHR